MVSAKDPTKAVIQLKYIYSISEYNTKYKSYIVMQDMLQMPHLINDCPRSCRALSWISNKFPRLGQNLVEAWDKPP